MSGPRRWLGGWGGAEDERLQQEGWVTGPLGEAPGLVEIRGHQAGCLNRKKTPIIAALKCTRITRDRSVFFICVLFMMVILVL